MSSASLIRHGNTGLYVDPFRGRVYRDESGEQPASFGTPSGHRIVSVRSADGDSVQLVSVARLVYEAVHGPLPDSLVLERVDGLPQDGRAKNFRAVPRCAV